MMQQMSIHELWNLNDKWMWTSLHCLLQCNCIHLTISLHTHPNTISIPFTHEGLPTKYDDHHAIYIYMYMHMVIISSWSPPKSWRSLFDVVWLELETLIYICYWSTNIMICLINLRWFSLAMRGASNTPNYVLFEFRMSNLWGFKISLINDLKPTRNHEVEVAILV